MIEMNVEESYAYACKSFRERLYEEALRACSEGLAGPELTEERRSEFLLLRCDLLQTAGNIDWDHVLVWAKEAKTAASMLSDPARSMRKAQALNRMGVAVRALAVAEGGQQFGSRISQLERARNHHDLALKAITSVDTQSPFLDQREVHSIIVSTYNNRASVLVEEAYLRDGQGYEQDYEKIRSLLEEALEQFSSCRSACDGLVPEARVATLNDEAEVLLRLARVCGRISELGSISLHRAYKLVDQAFELLDGITDRRMRLTWERLLREKICYSVENDLNYSDPVAMRLAEETFSVNTARQAELRRLERIRYQIATVDVYYTPWSPSLAGGRTREGTAAIRLERALERLRQTFSSWSRINTFPLRDGWHSLHIEDLRTALDAAVELDDAATVGELIETCRAQGYSAVPSRQARLPGDTVDSMPNRALAAIGIATVGSSPDIVIKGSSVVRQLAEQAIDVDLVRQSAVGADGWWWSLLRCGETVYWALLAPAALYSGKFHMSVDGEIGFVPSPIVGELTRRRRHGVAPLQLAISSSGGLGGICWATLPVGDGAGYQLVRHADIRIVPPVPLLQACMRRPKSKGPWPINLLVVADPFGNLRAQASLANRVMDLKDGSAIVLQSRPVASLPPGAREVNLANFQGALNELRHRLPGGTMVYSGHGIIDGRDPAEDFGLALEGQEKLTARNVIEWAGDAEGPTFPARVILAACQTIGVGQSTNEWTSIAPVALFAGAEVVLATCWDLVCDEVNLEATVELCDVIRSSADPVAALGGVQRSHLADDGSGRLHPSLLYSAVVGQGFH